MYNKSLEPFDNEIILILAKAHPYRQNLVENLYRFFDRSIDKTRLTMRLATTFGHAPADIMHFIKET